MTEGKGGLGGGIGGGGGGEEGNRIRRGRKCIQSYSMFVFFKNHIVIL